MRPIVLKHYTGPHHNYTYRFVGTPLAVWIRGDTLTTVTVATALVQERYFTWRIETQRYREMDIRLKEEREGVRRGGQSCTKAHKGIE